jgi:hypothetical protein
MGFVSGAALFANVKGLCFEFLFFGLYDRYPFFRLERKHNVFPEKQEVIGYAGGDENFALPSRTKEEYQEHPPTEPSQPSHFYGKNEEKAKFKIGE